MVVPNNLHQIQFDGKPVVVAVDPGLHFDCSIELAQNSKGERIPGYDVSVACDDPRSFFEDHRATLGGAQDYIRDCAGQLVLDKWPPRSPALVPATEIAKTLLCEADFE